MASETFDKRVTPARPDLAAANLRGKVTADRYVEGLPAQVVWGVADLRPRPDDQASLDTQALYGERCLVFDRKDGWAWVQLVRDEYVGYLRESALRWGGWREADMRVVALRAPVFSKADLKSPIRGYFPLNAELSELDRSGEYVSAGEDAWLSQRHVAGATFLASDWVATAERILGAPYLWGGKTPDGLDCSGLIQTSLHAAGLHCPRDTDMQERDLGEALPPGTNLRRGDLVFWKGHVGVMRSETELLHANAHHMAVAIEPVADAVARIAAKGTPVSSIRRLQAASV